MHNQHHELLINNKPYSQVLREQEKMRRKVQRGRESRNDMYALNKPEIYNKEDIIIKRGKKYLQIKLNNRKKLLPLVNIGSEKKPEYIAVLNPKKDRALSRHSAKELAHILKKLNISFVVSPPSSKSEKMIEKARKMARIKTPPLFLVGGSVQKHGKKHLYSKAEVVKLVDDGTRYWTIECRPITLAPNDPSKFFGINETMLNGIIAAVQNGEKIAIVDDVYSSGATIKAIIKLIKTALRELKIDIPDFPIVVVAQERHESELYKEVDDLQVYSKIVIPILNTI